VSARPAPTVDEFLRCSSPRGRALFQLVRELLDELEEAAPWSLLYAPPADGDALGTREGIEILASRRFLEGRPGSR